MIYSAGDCPVCSDSGALLLVTGASGGRVLTYCPACGCTWKHPSDAALPRDAGGLDSFGLRHVRAATMAEIDAAGLRASVRTRHGDMVPPVEIGVGDQRVGVGTARATGQELDGAVVDVELDKVGEGGVHVAVRPVHQDDHVLR